MSLIFLYIYIFIFGNTHILHLIIFLLYIIVIILFNILISCLFYVYQSYINQCMKILAFMPLCLVLTFRSLLNMTEIYKLIIWIFSRLFMLSVCE